MSEYEGQEEQVLVEYKVQFRPEGSDLSPAVPGVVSNGRHLDRIKEGTTAGIRHGLANASIEDLMKPRIRR